jgi:DNA-directed RNA polymerase specialized sigma24 family protein
VTVWLEGLRAGDGPAAQELWDGHFRRLVGLARAKLAGRPRTLNDPEDIALSAFNSFCIAAQQGRFPRLNDRHDLWQVLVMLTERKTIDNVRRAGAAKRRGAAHAPVAGTEESSDRKEIDNLVGTEPTPSFAAEVAEQCELLLNQLPEDSLRTIALLKLEGYTNEEMASRLTKSLATIERKLALIRKIWEDRDAHG